MPTVTSSVVWAKRFQTLLGLPPLFLRYCFYLLSFHQLYARSIHNFSQLMVLSPQLRRLYGMTSATERAYLRWFAKHIFTGQGAIVDLGCWLGSTTIPLAIGLVENSTASSSLRNIYAYDNFVWRSWMDPTVAGTPLE